MERVQYLLRCQPLLFFILLLFHLLVVEASLPFLIFLLNVAHKLSLLFSQVIVLLVKAHFGGLESLVVHWLHLNAPSICKHIFVVVVVKVELLVLIPKVFHFVSYNIIMYNF